MFTNKRITRDQNDLYGLCISFLKPYIKPIAHREDHNQTYAQQRKDIRVNMSKYTKTITDLYHHDSATKKYR
jgi:hypothetical protein